MTHKTRFLSFMTILVIALSSCTVNNNDSSGSNTQDGVSTDDTHASDTSSDTSSDSSEEIRTYTITWLNHDNSVLKVDEEVPHGILPTYDGETPTRIGNAQYEYTFKEWTPEVVVATSDQTYTATYLENVKSYTITWKNHDGTILETDTNVPYGTMPVYNGPEPTKTGGAQYRYDFTGWSPEIESCSGNKEYIAYFIEVVNAYTILWVNYDGTVLETDENVPYGMTPTYDGETPTKDISDGYYYIFSGWSPETISVADNQTYTALYDVSDSLDARVLIFTFNEITQTYIVSGFKYQTVVGDLVIPSTYNGYSVASIRANAFFNCASLTSIVIPDSVTIIGAYAFAGCTTLTSATIGNGVTSIGIAAFFGCTSLASINVRDGNANYSSINGILYNKDRSIFVCYPSGKTESSFIIPNSVTIIDYGAFAGCTSLTSIVIPDSVTTIGYGAFAGCTSLTSIVIPDSVTIIAAYAFCNCISIASITIPGSVTSIGYEAFSDCTSLTSIVIPDSVTSIGDSAFENCTSLTIYAEATSKPSGWSFAWNYSDRPVVWGVLGTYEGLSYVIAGSTGSEYVVITGYIGSPTNITIPSSINGVPVTSIGSHAFSLCSSLASIVIPDSVTTISVFAFAATSLKSIVIPNSVTILGVGAFYECTSLKSIVIPNGVTTIGNGTFSRCASLTSIVIPSSVTNIGYEAFSNCKSLTIYAEASSKPSGWHEYWNSSNRPVVWGYTGYSFSLSYNKELL